jgi:hypothetical protein
VKKIPGTVRLYAFLQVLLRPTYREDGLWSAHNADFLAEESFRRSYGAALERQPGTEMRWRTHVALWAGHQAIRLAGDFVECGVNRAFLSSAIMTSLDFAQHRDRHFYLFDTFDGLAPQWIGPEDKAAHWNEYEDVYEDVARAFQNYPNVTLVRGAVPATLPGAGVEKVAYLSIDMNCAAPEIEALRFFWPKMVVGGLVLLDDYGWAGHEAQKRGADEFADSVGARILCLPTGQGLLIKHAEALASPPLIG